MFGANQTEVGSLQLIQKLPVQRAVARAVVESIVLSPAVEQREIDSSIYSSINCQLDDLIG